MSAQVAASEPTGAQRAGEAAARAVGVDDDVADVAGIAGAAEVRRTALHQSAADTGRHHHAEQELRLLAGPAPVLPQGQADDVACQPNRQAGALVHHDRTYHRLERSPG